MIYQSIRQMKKMLGQLDTWLDKTSEYAKKKSFDANTLLAFRLAPDQFPFVRQVQTACDTAKFAVARLTGKEAPKHADDEQDDRGAASPRSLRRGLARWLHRQGLRGRGDAHGHDPALGREDHDGRGLPPRARHAELLLSHHPRLRDA